MRILVRTFLYVIAITGLGVVALAQSDADAPKQRDPEVKAKADALKRAVSDRRMSQDQDAIGIIDDLVVKYRAPMRSHFEGSSSKAPTGARAWRRSP